MSDTNSMPEGKQGLAARIIRTILVYALEMPQMPVDPNLSCQALTFPMLEQQLETESQERLRGRGYVEPEADEKALISNYGLNRQEASLAVRLVRGRSLEEAAAELRISTEVARTHFKRIFMKAELHSFLDCAARPKSQTGRSS
jgi:DNA-binding CsgD family transcriptional regulator